MHFNRSLYVLSPYISLLKTELYVCKLFRKMPLSDNSYDLFSDFLISSPLRCVQSAAVFSGPEEQQHNIVEHIVFVSKSVEDSERDLSVKQNRCRTQQLRASSSEVLKIRELDLGLKTMRQHLIELPRLP